MFRRFMFWSTILSLLSLLFFTDSSPKYFAGYASMLKTANLKTPTAKADYKPVHDLDLAKYRPTLRD